MKVFQIICFASGILTSVSARAEVVPQNPCQESAVQQSLTALNLSATQVFVFDITQTSSAVIIRLSSPTLRSVGNFNGEADITIPVVQSEAQSCQLGQPQVDLYDDNG